MGLSVSCSTGRLGKIEDLENILRVEYEAKYVGILTIGYSDRVVEKSRINYGQLTTWL
jgi:hypothetical protein